jgi:hypothetical protein
MTLRRILSDYRVAIDTAIIVGLILGARAILVAAGVDGMTLSPLTSSIVAGGVFVMGLVVAGTLSDYKDADRAPAEMATELYAILRDCESMDATWNKPDMTLLRQRLIAVVTTLRADIDAGNTRECQQAVEDQSESFLELEDTDVPANYIVRLRQEQSGLLRVIDKPFKVGRERTDDDVSLFLLTEFVVHAHAADEGVAAEDVEAHAEEVEELLSDVEEQEGDVTEVADLAGRPSSAAQD